MPGRRPIDTRQQTHDRLGTLKQQTHDLQNASEENKARTNLGLNQFSQTTSQQLADVITDETGTGNLVYSTNPILYTPQIGSSSRFITSDITTTTNTANQILMSFPLYQGDTTVGLNFVIGSADVIIQTDVSDSVGGTPPATVPEAVTKRRITKMLVVMGHGWDGNTNTNTISVDHTEYGHTASASSVATYNFAYNGTTKTFNILVSPSVNYVMRHRVLALCMFGLDKDWSAPAVVVP